jgi:NAD(P)-dependent dehydrogenase (short-subunit alcohol dehydrogenase family)
MVTSSRSPIEQFHLSGRVAVIIGAGSGIGRCTAELFAAVGTRVVIVDVNRTAAQTVVDAIAAAGGVAWLSQADISQESEIESMFSEVVERERSVDILVNNAGTAIRRPAIELSLADWDKVVSINMTGTFLCARTAARHMLKDDRGGVIVNIASIMGLSGGGLYPNISYQATKGAVVNMTRALAVECARQKIRVNAVAPTYVNTPFIAELMKRQELVAEIKRMTPMGRLVEPEEVAAAALFLASPADSMVTGHILSVDGGFLAQ